MVHADKKKMRGMDNFTIVGLFKDAVFIEEVIFYRR